MSRDGNLRSLFRLHLKKFHWQSIESHSTGRGTPDSNYCVDGVEGWVEFKAATGNRTKVRLEQVAWMESRARHGGRTFIAVRQVRDDTLWLFGGLAARHLLSCRLDAVCGDFFQAYWPGGPKAWDWGRIGQVLGQN
jgi:hypothetical protein